MKIGNLFSKTYKQHLEILMISGSTLSSRRVLNKPLVKDMSQQAGNRFLALEVENTSTEDNGTSVSILHEDQETQPISETPLPPKIYLRPPKTKTSTHIEVQLQTIDTGIKLGVIALLDCGAT